MNTASVIFRIYNTHFYTAATTILASIASWCSRVEAANSQLRSLNILNVRVYVDRVVQPQGKSSDDTKDDQQRAMTFCLARASSRSSQGKFFYRSLDHVLGFLNLLQRPIMASCF
jgi:hypothetical protein